MDKMNWYRRLLKEAVRKINISNTVNITNTGGLVPPPRQPNAYPLLWVDPVTKKPPEVIRWSWQPQTGEMRLGPNNAHVEQIGRNGEFDSWVRGFYFPARKQIAVRPFYWPEGPYDDWDQDHAALNSQVTGTVTDLLQKAVSKATIQTQVDNRWLSDNIDSNRRW